MLDQEIINAVDDALDSSGCGMGGDHPDANNPESELTDEEVKELEDKLKEMLGNM